MCLRQNRWMGGFAACLAVVACTVTAGSTAAQDKTKMEELGKQLFFDRNLSDPPGQSCAACHAPEVGFTGPDAKLNAAGTVYPGAVHSRFGNRKPPASAYAGASPVLKYDSARGAWVGGMFWDGRATGATLGDPLAEQAQGPFLNPLEQNVANAKQLCTKVARASYAPLFKEVWGPNSLDPVKDAAGTYERVARAIAAYERSPEVNPFSSKYDSFLKGEAKLTDQEASGLELFNGKAKCAECHTSQRGPAGEPPLFTDFGYDNLGLPKNPKNPFYGMPRKWNPDGAKWVDPGLGGYLKEAKYKPAEYESQWGKHKVPTLRNVDRRPTAATVKAFGHNGYFKSLEQIVSFYNTRDVGKWPPPEVPANVNKTQLGNLGLTADEEAAVVAFLTTLTDGYVPAGK